MLDSATVCANAAIDIFMAVAVLSRTTWEISRAGSVEAAQAELDCARVFIPAAMRRARRNVRALRSNQAGRLRAIGVRALATGELGPETPKDRGRLTSTTQSPETQ